MQKINKHIEIVSSGLPAFSCMNSSSRQTIQEVLEQQYRSVGITLINTPADLEALAASKPDLVFLGMKFIPSNLLLGVNDPRKIWISEYLDMQGIAYTGSGPGAIKLEATKQLAKQRVMDAGLASSRYNLVRHTTPQALQSIPLSFPMFVKPSDRGGGFGIGADSLVTTQRELEAKITAITIGLQADALVEEYLPGREFSVAVLKNAASGTLTTMPIELVVQPDLRGARILGHKIKFSNTERVLEVTDPTTRDAVCTLAQEVFLALGAREYGRIDIRLDAQGIPHFLEANLFPCLISDYGSFPKACELNSDLGYEAMILTIADLAFKRHREDLTNYLRRAVLATA